MLVLRDTSTGDCHLTDFDVDVERLAEGGYEIAGQLANAHRVTFNSSDDFDDIEDDNDTPQFTSCDWGYCQKWILLIDDMAPAFCSKHANTLKETA